MGPFVQYLLELADPLLRALPIPPLEKEVVLVDGQLGLEEPHLLRQGSELGRLGRHLTVSRLQLQLQPVDLAQQLWQAAKQIPINGR